MTRSEQRDSMAALRALFGAIARRERSEVSRLLTEGPELARQASVVGATRAEAKAYYFEEIAHYVYAGDTALHVAAAAYAVDIARELASRGADVHAKNRRGARPLHYATDGVPGSRGWNPDAQYAMVELLSELGADVNAKDNDGVAPLHRAVRTRSAAAVRALLQNGADARVGNKNESTPLHLAVQTTGRGGSGSPMAREQQAEIIRLLLRHGASDMDRDSAGKSVRDSVRADWIRALLNEH
jgi:ankyrin repeat protein